MDLCADMHGYMHGGARMGTGMHVYTRSCSEQHGAARSSTELLRAARSCSEQHGAGRNLENSSISIDVFHHGGLL